MVHGSYCMPIVQRSMDTHLVWESLSFGPLTLDKWISHSSPYLKPDLHQTNNPNLELNHNFIYVLFFAGFRYNAFLSFLHLSMKIFFFRSLSYIYVTCRHAGICVCACVYVFCLSTVLWSSLSIYKGDSLVRMNSSYSNNGCLGMS